MSLSKLFQRIIWHNNTTPAINEDNLNAMSKAIDDIDDRVILIGDDVVTVIPQIQAYLEQAESIVEAVEELSQNPPYIGANGNWWVFDTTLEAYKDSGVDASITVDIADINLLPVGSTPYVTNTGTSTDPIFHLYIPQTKSITSVVKDGGFDDPLIDKYDVVFNDNTRTSFYVTNGVGIVSITKTGTQGLVDTYEIACTDGMAYEFTVTNGATGNGIANIAKTSTQGLVDTYTITMTDGTTYTFTVTNGQNGSGTGDMLQSDYDSDSAVKNGGGIKAWVQAWVQSLGYITGLAWSALTGKPFSTVGNGLTVSNDALTANVKTVEINYTGTASATGVRYQRIGVNGVYTAIDGTKYMEYSQTLSTSADTVYTFTNAAIKADSAVDVWTDIRGITTSNEVTTNGQSVITFPKQSTAQTMTCRIYIK